MDRPKILATHRLFEEPRAKLAEHFDAEYWSDSDRPSRTEVLRRVADKDGLICLLTEKIDEELLAAAPHLRTVANIAVGYDNIDVDACTRHNVAASNTPGVLDETTADFAWTLLMAVARRLIEGDALARSGEWKGWNLDQLCGADIWGKTLGILGFGRIGRSVARRAYGFGMRVIYNDAVRAPVVSPARAEEKVVVVRPCIARAETALRLPGRTGAAAQRRWYKPGGGGATRGRPALAQAGDRRLSFRPGRAPRPILRAGLFRRAAGRGEGDEGGPLRADGPSGDRALGAGAAPTHAETWPRANHAAAG